MATVNSLAEMHAEITAWRRHLHENPELQYDVHDTAAFVAAKLREFGLDEVVTGIGRTGVVGVIKGRADGAGKVIGMRADMDALPIKEATGLPHASRNDGKMHACGHDGHTTMLLGAARHLAETRNFGGTVVVIFQPAEEGGAGGRAMVEDGLMERFGIQEVYGMHNMPSLPVGEFAIRPGPIMASTDQFTIVLEGVGGHAALPERCIDTTVVGAHLVTALQSIVSRNIDPQEAAVVSVTSMRGDTDTYNVLPHRVELKGTVRTLSGEVQDQIRKRVTAMTHSIAEAFGATARISWFDGYPVTVNHERQTEIAVAVAEDVAGAGRVEPNHPPLMGAEDFSYMLQARPGAFIFTGNGDSAGLHHPNYDFNDEAIMFGSSYWVRLAERTMPV